MADQDKNNSYEPNSSSDEQNSTFNPSSQEDRNMDEDRIDPNTLYDNAKQDLFEEIEGEIDELESLKDCPEVQNDLSSNIADAANDLTYLETQMHNAEKNFEFFEGEEEELIR